MKKLLFVLISIFVLGLAGQASAISVTPTVTGDNWVWIWGGPWANTGSNSAVWQSADSIPLNLTAGVPVDLYFAVMNETPAGSYANPAGFLGQVTTSGTFLENGLNKLLTNTTNWEVASVPVGVWALGNAVVRPAEGGATRTTPTFDPATAALSWIIPTSYGADNENPSLGWNWTPVSGIDDNAKWLWTANNYNTVPNSMDHLAVFRTTVTPIPEPTSLGLLGLGLLGLARKLRKK